MKIEIRKVDKSQAERVAEVEALCFPSAEAAGKEAFAKRFASPAYCCYGAYDEENQLIGFVNGGLYDKPVLPDELYQNPSLFAEDGEWQTVFGLDVLPLYRRRGIAMALLETLIEESRRQNRRGLVLTCKDYLRPLYESAGFVWQGVSQSTHGNAVWNDMLLQFDSNDQIKEGDAEQKKDGGIQE